MRRSRFVVLGLGIALFGFVATAQAKDQPQPQQDMLSFGLGYFDFDKTEHHKRSADFRLEYRWGDEIYWGDSLLPSLRPSTSEIQFHPAVVLEPTSRGSLYGGAGFAMDWRLDKHWVFTWSEDAGFFEQGNAPFMGSAFQFRSMAEFGYVLDGGTRVTAELSHISDANITQVNPGAEIGGVYLHVPVGTLLGR